MTAASVMADCIASARYVMVQMAAGKPAGKSNGVVSSDGNRLTTAGAKRGFAWPHHHD